MTSSLAPCMATSHVGADPCDEAAREVLLAKAACVTADVAQADACTRPGRSLRGSDVDLADWDDLLHAVKGRLTRIVCESAPQTSAEAPSDATLVLQAGVLDCVSALDQLHLTLAHELQRRRRITREAADSGPALLVACELGRRGDVQLVGQGNPDTPEPAQADRTAQVVAAAAAPAGIDDEPATDDRPTAPASAAASRVSLTARQGADASASPSRRVLAADDMNGLLRRARFREQLGRVMARRGSPRPVLAVLILGLDDVTTLAGTHGQGISDELLRIVGARLVRALRAQDLVTRLWSDEYACLLADVPSREQLGRVACKLFDIVAAPIRLGVLELSMRPSIGISASPGDADNADSMLVCADVAMYRARHQNSGYAFFDASLGVSHAPRLQA